MNTDIKKPFSLKGPRLRNLKDYKNPDILDVNVDDTDMYYNKIMLTKNLDRLFFYHMYNGTNYSGRYYDIRFNKNKLKMKNNTIQFNIKNYENEITNTKKTVTVKITFSDMGKHKLQKFMSHF